jgi:hypothetical protein
MNETFELVFLNQILSAKTILFMRISTSTALIVISILSFHNTICVAGPISPSRGILIRPNWETGTSDTTETLGEIGTWGSVYHGFKSANDEFGWSIDIGALIEFARWGESSSLIAVTDMELSAKTNNDIYFSPRGGFWEEGILYNWRAENLDWQFGYLHRCRHDLDNGDSIARSGAPLERTLIYGSFTGKAISKPFNLFHATDPKEWKTIVWLTGDLYVFREDYRQTSGPTSLQPNFHDILFSIGANAAINLFRIGPGVAYIRGGANFSAFGIDGSLPHSFTHIESTTLDGRIEIGYQSEGRAARLQLFTGWENFNDDGSTPIPENSHFTLLGVRLSGTALTY